MSALGTKYKMNSTKYKIQIQKLNTNYKKHKYKIQPCVRNEGSRPPLISKTQYIKYKNVKVVQSTKYKMKSTKYKKVQNTIMCEK